MADLKNPYRLEYNFLLHGSGTPRRRPLQIHYPTHLYNQGRSPSETFSEGKYITHSEGMNITSRKGNITHSEGMNITSRKGNITHSEGMNITSRRAISPALSV